jgi:hypothetical protein
MMPRKIEYLGRTVELIYYSRDEKAEFDAWAEEHGAPTATFLMAQLRNLKDSAKHKRPVSRSGREIELQAQIASLQEELRLTKAALQKAKLHLSLIPPRPGTAHQMDSRMISILKNQGPLREEVLFSMLNIGESDREMEDLMRLELEALEGFGLISKSSRGWKWVDK